MINRENIYDEYNNKLCTVHNMYVYNVILYCTYTYVIHVYNIYVLYAHEKCTNLINDYIYYVYDSGVIFFKRCDVIKKKKTFIHA